MIRCLLICLLTAVLIPVSAQVKKATYHPCFLMDSVDKNLSFIQQNAGRIFVDSFDCKQTLLDSIAIRYVATKDAKYLTALSTIRQNPNAKVDELYTDIIKRIIEDDFGGFLNQLYLARGRYAPLEKELIATMNMIVAGKPLKQKFAGLLNVEMGKAKDAKDTYKLYYLQKLKGRIDAEKY